MEKHTLPELYRLALKHGNFQPDDMQQHLMMCLDKIQQYLMAYWKNGPSSSRWRWRFAKWARTSRQQPNASIRGLYIWGGVGRGKTWLMDLFYQSIAGERVLRLHFHRFMQRVHQELTLFQGKSDPLLAVAKRFKLEADVLCFDEFFVTDITDAMLLGTLLIALFNQGIVLIATSNIPPDELYANGLQRARFLPAVVQIKMHCDIVNLDSGIDYAP